MGDRARVFAELAGKGSLCAVLDGARDPRIGRLVAGKAPAHCLYRGKLPQELADAAPQLLQFRPGHDYADIFFRIGWRNAWGILLACRGPVPVLHRHLRRMLLARSGRTRLVFRYYDPRVLRVYLPSCTAAELERFFGPVNAFVAEGEQAGEFHLFRRGGTGFEHLRVESGDAPARVVKTWAAEGALATAAAIYFGR